MELKEFVKSAILDIIEGVLDAQNANTTDAVINASTHEGNGWERRYLDLDFDIALTATKSKSNGRGLDVLAAGLAKGLMKKSSREESAEISRLKFTVPIRLPSPPSSGSR